MHIHAAAAVVDNQLQNNICVRVEKELISSISENCTASADVNVDGTLIPGFVDIHCHGGAGFYFSDTNIENVKTAREMHRSHGTTTLLASLVTEPIGILEEQIRRLAPLVDDGVFAGIHLEGPYLSEARCGAHQPSLLRDPAIEELAALIDTSNDTVAMVTLAPEREGGLDAVQYLASRGVAAALGHSQADGQITHNAIEKGAALITHFSNGMPKPADGAGTIASAALETSGFPVEIILDGIHVNEEILNQVKSSGSDRIILITDAMAAAGAGDGKFTIGALAVTVADGVARLDSNNSLAGSTLTMDTAFRNYMKSGASIVESVSAASTLPAMILGLKNVGSISVGKKADLLQLSDELDIKVIEVASRPGA